MIGDSMEMLEKKEQFIRFAQIFEKIKDPNMGGIRQVSLEDKIYLEKIKDKFINSPTYRELLEKIMNAPQGESYQVIEEFYAKRQKEDNKPEEHKPEEEQIAKVFGVSADQIKHLYLKNGKEVFCFYSSSLGKDIVLENNKKGKSISEVLKELQEQDEKYQSDDPSENSKDIMMDERLKSNMELKMYPPSEIPSHTAEIASLTAPQKILLNHLLKHAEELDIKVINIENLIYINNSHELKEITFDKNFNPVTETPAGEEPPTSEDETEKSEEENTTSNTEQNEKTSNELSDMFMDDNETKTNQMEKQEKKGIVKKLIYTTNQDKAGYVTNIAFLIFAVYIMALAVLTIYMMLA